MKCLSTNEIRDIWLKFFSSKKHLVIPSKSLIPINDSSLLWINSGVATLKKYFSGIENPPSPRLTNSQKAIRTNDILNVGVTARHHAFFEMLGNFSIGDYFKKEAVSFAYELLTKHYEIDVNKLYFTVYEKDEDTYNNWITLGIDKEHILRGNKERNFWDIGQGPCGPCTEIYYDRGEKYDFEKTGIKLFRNDIENDRYIEIWNIVFSQFNNDGNGNYTELTRKNIDTGAGLERLASVSQDVPTDFDTDAFLPSIRVLEQKSKFKYDISAFFNKKADQLQINHDFKVIVDHIKANIFAIADGALPSNKDRGSVLRKLIRRAVVCSRRLKIDNYIDSLVDSIIKINHEYYPYLIDQKSKIVAILQKEIESFSQTLEQGYKLFNQTFEKTKVDIDSIFKLVDTYGFPFEIINELASERGIKIDEQAYLERLEKHKNISRAKTEGLGMEKQKGELVNFSLDSKFDYDSLEIKDAIVIACFDEDFHSIKEFKGKGWIVFDKTPFYATSGGQQHDNGTIELNRNKIEIIDVIKSPNGQHLHFINTIVAIKLGDKANLSVDKECRTSLSRNHSSEHLIQHALQTIVSKTIKQEGAFKSPEKVTFDFQYPNKLTNEQLEAVENQINEYIKLAINVKTHHMTLKEAKEFGAIAWFDDVYAKIKEKLRVVQMKDISTEICGGTHVSNTADIEQFMFIKFSNKGAGSWRVEGITGKNNIDKYLQEQIGNFQIEINKLSNELQKNNIKTSEFNKLLDAIDYRIDVKHLREIRLIYPQLKNIYDKLMIQMNKQASSNKLNAIKTSSQSISKSGHLIIINTKNIENKIINQALTDLINESKNQSYVIINTIKNKIQYFVGINKQTVLDKHITANLIINKINQISGGFGNGKETFAQGGTTNIESFDKILKYLINEF